MIATTIAAAAPIAVPIAFLSAYPVSLSDQNVEQEHQNWVWHQ